LDPDADEVLIFQDEVEIHLHPALARQRSLPRHQGRAGVVGEAPPPNRSFLVATALPQLELD
jgi:hypothetical protein